MATARLGTDAHPHQPVAFEVEQLPAVLRPDRFGGSVRRHAEHSAAIVMRIVLTVRTTRGILDAQTATTQATSGEAEMSEAPLFAATTFTEIYERALVGPLFRPFAAQM